MRRDPPAIDRLAVLADKARALGQELKSLASDIESAALDAEELIQQMNKDSAKLHQLQELLKGI